MTVSVKRELFSDPELAPVLKAVATWVAIRDSRNIETIVTTYDEINEQWDVWVYYS